MKGKYPGKASVEGAINLSRLSGEVAGAQAARGVDDVP